MNSRDRFLAALRRQPHGRAPVWIMRQAGRYLPEYMEVRSKVTFIELCKRPDLAAEVTLTAQRVLGVDAAILFADLLPKRLAVLYPERCALGVIGPIQTCLRVLRPVVWLFNGAADLFLKLFGVPTHRVEQITTEDITAMVGAGAEAGVLRKHELAMIENVFELESRTITSVMTVRDEVVYFTTDEPLESIKLKIIAQPHAEYLVCRDDIDSVLGFIASKDILKQILSEESASVIRNLAKHFDKNLLVLPDTLNLSQALTRFREMHQSFGAVINEYGLVVGIVTLTDFLHHAGLDGPARLGERLRALLRPSGRSHSLHPEVAGQIMTHPVRTASADLHVGELVPLLSDRSFHHLPIVDERQRLVGMVTQSDLVAALYHMRATATP